MGIPDKGSQYPTRHDSLERAVLREELVFNAMEVAAETGVTVSDSRRLWRALGFPDHRNEVAFTRSDAEALSTVFQIIDGGAVDVDLAVRLTRAVGQTISRLADWEVATLAHRIEEIEASDQGTGSRTATALKLIEEVNEPFEAMLIYAWRRHLAAALARMEALESDADLHAVTVTVGFADIVSFTQLSNSLDHDHIGDLVEVFEARCSDAVATNDGRVIKTIGDSVLFINSDPVHALRTAEDIISLVGKDRRLPAVRVGLATGPVTMRMGDVFGPAVNLAARLTAVARRNRFLVDGTTAEALPAQVFETRALPARPVRGFGLVEPVTVRRR